MENTVLGTGETRKRFFQTGRSTGLFMVLTGATFWGLSGTAAQRLFQTDGFSPAWLVSMRMGISGLLLLLAVGSKIGWKRVFAVWFDKKDWLRIIIFGLVGLVGVQYTYFASIDLGNAATATFLQYLAPAFIIVFLAIRSRKSPDKFEFTALSLALVGTFLLVTNGSTQQFIVPLSAVIWGLLSAVALAFYTLYPGKLMSRWGSALTAGWGMVIGGVAMSLVIQPWHTKGQHWSYQSAALVTFVILFGTLIAFYLYLASMRYISPSETSLVASFEPLSAAVAGVIWLHTQLGFASIVGAVCILAIVIVLSSRTKSV